MWTILNFITAILLRDTWLRARGLILCHLESPATTVQQYIWAEASWETSIYHYWQTRQYLNLDIKRKKERSSKYFLPYNIKIFFICFRRQLWRYFYYLQLFVNSDSSRMVAARLCQWKDLLLSAIMFRSLVYKGADAILSTMHRTEVWTLMWQLELVNISKLVYEVTTQRDPCETPGLGYRVVPQIDPSVP